jgi:hypothetical protein
MPRAFFFPSQAPDHLAFKQLVDQASFLGKNTFDDPARKIAENDTVTSDPKAMVAREIFPQG